MRRLCAIVATHALTLPPLRWNACRFERPRSNASWTPSSIASTRASASRVPLPKIRSTSERSAATSAESSALMSSGRSGMSTNDALGARMHFTNDRGAAKVTRGLARAPLPVSMSRGRKRPVQSTCPGRLLPSLYSPLPLPPPPPPPGLNRAGAAALRCAAACAGFLAL